MLVEVRIVGGRFEVDEGANIKAYSQSILRITPILHRLWHLLQKMAQVVVKHLQSQQRQQPPTFFITIVVLHLHRLFHASNLFFLLLHHPHLHTHLLYFHILLLRSIHHILKLGLWMLVHCKSGKRCDILASEIGQLLKDKSNLLWHRINL